MEEMRKRKGDRGGTKRKEGKGGEWERRKERGLILLPFLNFWQGSYFEVMLVLNQKVR